ncbi:PrpF domain-containing protein [Devosia sp. YIM 151766]|uniref:PrpF domain-containing protein n=1 Tax=Devosia sp. YIM 151766 TaxID=3017325 RepID=UPI00255C8ABD|nr:PrpF domain-containing protein [Devosia sp. YIM 151766]WIY53174.1 PrpF domain-containing protein [Devosia sp. YIM 151766]
MPTRIPATIMRGGTSRAVFLDGRHLPANSAEREQIILEVFGSPDPRQIDGLGGADPLTSKLAIIDRPDPEMAAQADVVYTFGQVGIAEPRVDWHSLCGNISAAVGLYAIETGMVGAVEPVTTVRVFNTNLNRILHIDVQVEDGAPRERGTFAVPGVPGTGSEIVIDFATTAGATTGALMPTGQVMDTLAVDGIGPVQATLLDIGNAHVFIRAADVGLTGTETAAQIDADEPLRHRLEAIRGAAAMRMNMIAGPAAAARTQSPATPILALIAAPAGYRVHGSGQTIAQADVDVVARLQFMQQTHKTYAGTSTVCTGVASRIAGTIVHEAARPKSGTVLRIGHPAGVIETTSIVAHGHGGAEVRRATLGRTARRIMDGTVYLPAWRSAQRHETTSGREQ